MQRPLTSPTSLVLLQSRRSRTRSLRTSCRLLPPHGKPDLSFRPSHVEPPLLCSLNPTAGKAAATLHTMAILQFYQAEVLKEMDEGDGLLKEATEEVHSSDLNHGFFSRYSLVLKKDGGLHPILDLRRLNYYLYRGKFRMLTLKSILSQVQEGDWFVTVDFKDTYFHIQVVQRHRKVRFRGKGLPINGSSLWASSGPKDVHQV